MSITIWDFMNQGGKVVTSGGFVVNNIVLIANTNPYPISANVQWTNNYSLSLSWDANGAPHITPSDPSLYLQPVKTVISYVMSSNTTLSSVNSYSQWANNNNQTRWLI